MEDDHPNPTALTRESVRARVRRARRRLGLPTARAVRGPCGGRGLAMRWIPRRGSTFRTRHTRPPVPPVMSCPPLLPPPPIAHSNAPLTAFRRPHGTPSPPRAARSFHAAPLSAASGRVTQVIGAVVDVQVGDPFPSASGMPTAVAYSGPPFVAARAMPSVQRPHRTRRFAVRWRSPAHPQRHGGQGRRGPAAVSCACPRGRRAGQRKPARDAMHTRPPKPRRRPSTSRTFVRLCRHRSHCRPRRPPHSTLEPNHHPASCSRLPSISARTRCAPSRWTPPRVLSAARRSRTLATPSW